MTAVEQKEGKLGRTAVLLPSSLTESFEIVLARITDLLGQNVPVTVVACGGTVKGCVANYIRSNAICAHCCRVRDSALKDIEKNFEFVVLDRYLKQARVDQQAVENPQLKIGAKSTVLTFYRREPSVNSFLLNKKIFGYLEECFSQHSRFIYQCLVSFVGTHRIDRLEFFNGRIVPTHAALLAARNAQCDYGVIEVSGKEKKLFVTDNASVHDRGYLQAELLRFIELGGRDLRVGKEFFESRRGGRESDVRSFTSTQKAGVLQTFNLPVISVFTSSADELKVAGEQWFTKASLDPAAFILELTGLVAGRYQIVVRMHPNQAGDKTGMASEMISTLKSSASIYLITPQSDVSSYELLDASHAVLTFGSTIGLEATYWGKPSILAGRTLWDCLDIAYTVDSPREIQTLLAGDLRARSKEDAIGVACYYMTGVGQPSSLSWRHNGTVGFSVNGKSYLSLKRSSVYYWLSRLIDKALRWL